MDEKHEFAKEVIGSLQPKPKEKISIFWYSKYVNIAVILFNEAVKQNGEENASQYCLDIYQKNQKSVQYSFDLLPETKKTIAPLPSQIERALEKTNIGIIVAGSPSNLESLVDPMVSFIKSRTKIRAGYVGGVTRDVFPNPNQVTYINYKGHQKPYKK